jgi:hypothetical protein
MTTRGGGDRTLYLVASAALLGDAMTGYVLAAGSAGAPAAGAPEYMAAWLDAHGHRIVRIRDDTPVDPDDSDLVDGIAAMIDWRSICQDDADRRAILRQVLHVIATTPTDVHRVE